MTESQKVRESRRGSISQAGTCPMYLVSCVHLTRASSAACTIRLSLFFGRLSPMVPGTFIAILHQLLYFLLCFHVSYIVI